LGERQIDQEIRVGRNYIRTGDPVKVRLPHKTQFRDGFIFKGWDVKEQKAVVKTPQGVERYVDIDGIKRKQVTKQGQRLQ
jgi:hypothetical protein